MKERTLPWGMCLSSEHISQTRANDGMMIIVSRPIMKISVVEMNGSQGPEAH